MYVQAASIEIDVRNNNIQNNNNKTFLLSTNTHIYICVCIHTDNEFHLIYISYSQARIYAHMLTNSYDLNVVYSHEDTQ